MCVFVCVPCDPCKLKTQKDVSSVGLITRTRARNLYEQTAAAFPRAPFSPWAVATLVPGLLALGLGLDLGLGLGQTSAPATVAT